MRSIIILTCIALIHISGITSQLWGKDLAEMSFRELFILRPTIKNAPASEQEAFQLEWDRRLQSMTEEERRQIESYEKRSEFPNPYVQGRGYENQGVNSATFEADDLKDQLPVEAVEEE